MVKSAIQSIAFDPERFVKIDSQHHCFNHSKFPFQIVYRFNKEMIQVIESLTAANVLAIGQIGCEKILNIRNG